MSIRIKTFITIAVFIGFVIIAAAILLGTLYLNRLNSIESDQSEKNLDRVREYVIALKGNQDTKLSDWAVWDDAYQFISDGNQEFIGSNLTDLVLTNLKLSSMVFLASDGSTVYSIQSESNRKVDPGFLQYLESVITSRKNQGIPALVKSVEGFFVHDGMIYLISAAGSLPTSGEGEPVGVILFVKPIVGYEVEQISTQLKFPVQVTYVPSGQDSVLPEPVAGGKGVGRLVQTEKTLEGYLGFSPVNTGGTVLIHLTLQRVLYGEGIRSTFAFVLSFIAFGVVLTGLLLSLLDRLILSRLAKVTENLTRVDRGESEQKRLESDPSGDEISMLITSINTMLDRIKSKRREVEKEQERARTYFDVAGTMLVVLDAKGDITMINRKGLELIGYDNSEVIGKNWFEVCLPAEERESVRQIHNSIVAGGAQNYMYHQNKILTKTGKEKFMDWHNTVIRNPDGSFVAVVSSGQDITDVKRREEESRVRSEEIEKSKLAMMNLLTDAKTFEDELRREKDRLQAVLSSMGEGLVVVDWKGVIQQINPAAAGLFDISEPDAKGREMKDVVDLYASGNQVPTDARPVYVTLRKGLRYIGKLTDNHEFKNRKGRSFPVIIISTPIFSPQKTIEGATIVFRDATTEKQQYEVIERTVMERTQELSDKNKALELAQAQISEGWLQLQREKARLSSSIDAMSFGFILTDRDFNIVHVNSSALSLLGLTRPPVHLKEIEAVFDNAAEIHNVHDRCISERRTVTLEALPHQAKIFDLSATPVTLVVSGNSETIGLVLVLEDITERKTLERSRDEFFSIASHELRTPLTAIRGNTSMIMDYFQEALKDPELVEMITDIHQSSVRLIEIVNDFLDTSRLEMKRMEFKKVSFGIAGMVREVFKEFESAGLQQKVALCLEGDDQIKVMADQDKTKQVIINLVGNALKFTRDGTVTVKVNRTDKLVAVSIEDTGRGIPVANQALLFHKFQQAGSSLFTRDTTKGTGLGLYISKLLVEGMGGSVRLVRSAEGAGSEFEFTLPVD